MFHEFHELIVELKASDRYFQNLFEKHTQLDQKIKNMESRLEPATPDDIEALKKKKQAIEEELHELLQQVILCRTRP